MTLNVEWSKLQDFYSRERLIPFIGAGLSVPFQIPNWNNLIVELINNVPKELRPAVRFELESKNYWNAVNSIMRFGHMDERQIQEQVVQLINQHQIKCTNDEEHNYSDIGRMNFRNILTTNYDHWAFDYLQGERLMPQILSQSSVSSHELVLERSAKRIWHLHGNISDTGSIVLTREKYNSLYKENRYRSLFSLLSGSNVLLIMGFSFDDEYIQQLFMDYKDIFQARHYILLDKPTTDTISELKNKYRLEVIPYDTSNSSHVEEIRKILLKISDNGKNSIVSPPTEEDIFVNLPDEKTKDDLNKNLFCKKIKLEEIDNQTFERSKDFFFFADQYIRKLRKKRFDERVIGSILLICANKYADLKESEYSTGFNSQKFISEVHKQLGNIDYGRITNIIKDIMPFDFENKGFVHILADDWEKNIWWGESRIGKDEYYVK